MEVQGRNFLACHHTELLWSRSFLSSYRVSIYGAGALCLRALCA
jgi:hypothetical protein